MVDVFREVRRVLRDDGTLWLNLGDSYINNPASAVNCNGMDGSLNDGKTEFDCRVATRGSQQRKTIPSGLKVKDLAGIPWRVAFALQVDGWYLRSDIIWHKPNPMPESVTDRPTKAHEYLFLLSKCAKYWYDHEAIAEPLATKAHAPGNKASGRLGHNGKTDNCVHQPDRIWGASGTRNRRTVWTVESAPYKGAHFATFPPKLIRPCILAGCPAGGTVLDPFGGSGTTGEVAEMEGRNSILVELNPEYVTLAKKRTAQMGLFT